MPGAVLMGGLNQFSRARRRLRIYIGSRPRAATLRTIAGLQRCLHEKTTSSGKRERKMTNSTKILYDHLKDYPTSTEGYHDVSIPAVAAALRYEHQPKNENRKAPLTDEKEKAGHQ
jgi:hypothetical protein